MKKVYFGTSFIPFCLTLFVLLLCFISTVQASRGRVLFIGNSVIDYESVCEWGSGYTGATASIYIDDQLVFETSEQTSTNRVEAFYRDTHVTRGGTYKYSYCCQYEGPNGISGDCPRPSGQHATAGEAGGILTHDLEISGGTLALQKSIDVLPGVTLSIDNAAIERAPESRYGRISGLSREGFGTIRITNSTLTPEIRLEIHSAGENLLSNNIINGSTLRIDSEANVTISGNTLIDLAVEIDDDTTSAIIQNSFQNSRVDIGPNQGEPTVLIDRNEFTGPETGTVVTVRGGDVSILNNNFMGQYSEQYNRYAADGISVYGMSGMLRTIISGNLFSGFDDAISLSDNAAVTATNNIFSGNDTGCSVMGTALATFTGNTFTENRVGIDFRAAGLDLNSNCFAGNTNRGVSHSYGEAVVNATNNWWGASSGPQNTADNPAGTGDSIYNRTAGTVNFTPWLTESTCKTVPTPPEPEPATLTVNVNPSTLPADGQSTVIVTITLQDENSQPIANASIALGTPEFGHLSQLSGTTDGAGQFQVVYEVPTAGELNGSDFVELNVQSPSASVGESAIINFTFASLSIWADPHIAPYSSEVAIIPGDSRFPGRYQFTLRDAAGQPFPDEELTVRIEDSSRARLEGDNQAGSQITVTTDAQGRAIVNYIYLGSAKFDSPLEDTITITHPSFSAPVTATVSVGLNIGIGEVNTPQQDSGFFPKTLGMRLELEDDFRPMMDLRSYLSALEDLSGHTIAVNISTEWLNPPEPAFMDRFQAIFPNYGNDDEPELYQGTCVLNYGDNPLQHVIAEALDSPHVTFGANTLPAILFTDPGNYWFAVYANPVILPAGATTSSDFVRGASQPNMGRMFGANILEGSESVFQSVVCSVKPTTKAQFVAMTLFVDNPYFQIVPPIAAANMVTKASGLICDYMQGNYVTAAVSMMSLGADGLENAYTSGALDITLEQFNQLGKLVRLNKAYSKFDNLKSGRDLFFANAPSQAKESRSPQISFQDSDVQASQGQSQPLDNYWPEDLDLAEYAEIIGETMAGEMSASSDMNGWQVFGILNDGDVSTTTALDESEYFSNAGVHVYLLPAAANTINIQTTSNTEIYRYYRASNREVYSAEYRFTPQNNASLLSLSLQTAEMTIDNGADGTFDDSFSPAIRAVDTTPTTLNIIANQENYQTGDTIILSTTLDNPGEGFPVDVYFTGTGPSGQVFSFPDIAPGQVPMLSNYVIPADFHLPETTIFTFPVLPGLSGAGQFKIDAFLTYPGTMNIVGGNVDSTVINFLP